MFVSMPCTFRYVCSSGVFLGCGMKGLAGVVVCISQSEQALGEGPLLGQGFTL